MTVLDSTSRVPASHAIRDGIIGRFPPLGGSGKRLFDITAASLLLFCFAPLLALIAVTMWMSERGAVFFGHTRVGYGGSRFRCFKFRTMVPDAQAVLERYLEDNPAARSEWDANHKLRNDPRITPLGRFLRETSLDELPQLVNVIRGEMSLVGPRPIVQAEVRRYAGRIDSYLIARPGITGLWQVSGRSDVDYDRRVGLDAEYVETWSFTQDLRILTATIRVVFSREGSC